MSKRRTSSSSLAYNDDALEGVAAGLKDVADATDGIASAIADVATGIADIRPIDTDAIAGSLNSIALAIEAYTEGACLNALLSPLLARLDAADAPNEEIWSLVAAIEALCQRKHDYVPLLTYVRSKPRVLAARVSAP